MICRWKVFVASTLALLVSSAWLPAVDALRWNKEADSVDAVVENWTVPQMLQRVARATGWRIFVDPGITNRVVTRFTNKAPGEALSRLLKDYSYALVPETNGPNRLLVFRNSRDQATQAVEPLADSDGKTGLIGNELIVTLKPGEKIDDLAKRLGAKVVGRSDELNAYRLQFDDDKAAQNARTALENDPAVEDVDNNYYVSRPETPMPMGTPGGPIALNPKLPADGKYTIVGLVDSAVQPKEGDFAQFILPDAKVDTISGGELTHGTSMAATILRALAAMSEDKSTAVRLLPVDIFGKSMDTTTYDIAVGIFRAVEGGAPIVNLSLGGEGNSTFLHNTIKNAHENGVIFLAAAGNEPTTRATFPAAYPEVIAVTAIDREGKIASYANRGDFVDVAAPGGTVITYNGQQYYIAGTSTSTAFASGLAAALAEGQKLKGKELEAALREALSRAASTQPGAKR